MAKKQDEADKEYWIVNPKGAVHKVDREDALRRLRVVGWRMATAAEIKRAKTPNRIYQDGTESVVQNWKNPFGKPYSPESELDTLDLIPTDEESGEGKGDEVDAGEGDPEESEPQTSKK